VVERWSSLAGPVPASLPCGGFALAARLSRAAALTTDQSPSSLRADNVHYVKLEAATPALLPAPDAYMLSGSVNLVSVSLNLAALQATRCAKQLARVAGGHTRGKIVLQIKQ
jgi:hypothetical protein